MERLSSKTIKKIMLGVAVADGHISDRGRLDFYSKHEEYATFVYNVLQQITHIKPKFYIKKDKRGYVGFRVTTKNSSYFKGIYDKLYDGRKKLSKYIISRLDEQSLAHIYMCDGYTEHAKNRKTNKVQNIGWFCLEAFDKPELEMFQDMLLKNWGIESSLVRKPWGFGYRIRVGGKNLQKLISVMSPYFLDCFRYKLTLFYKGKEYVEDLPNAEQYISFYENVEDIVRYSQK
jgi:hypothetical protein